MSFDPGLLASSVLYFASSAAQVWAALMVFQVLLVRDLCMYRDNEEASIVTEGRRWLGMLLSDANKDNLAGWSDVLGIDIIRTLVKTANGDETAQTRLLRAVSAKSLFRTQSISGALEGVPYDPQEIQERVDALVVRLDTMATTYPDPTQTFRTGLISLALNLGALALYGFLGADASSLIGILGALVVANFALGLRFAKHVRRALACY